MALPENPSLVDLRDEIDRIDRAMHDLLLDRGKVIETLIRVKQTGVSGSAFRPGREADIMRRVAQRHTGILPLDTVESIWRVIIATFTYVQAPFSVHADTASGDAPMRDTARFHFGFTVPFLTHTGTGDVINSVANSAGDLGIFPVTAGASGGAWWHGLEGRDRPKVIARLPFIERPRHPAGTPVYVIAKPLADAAVRDVVLVSLSMERWHPKLKEVVAGLGATIEGNVGDARGLLLLVALSGDAALNRLSAALGSASVPVLAMAEVGSHANRFEVGSQRLPGS
jgi:chorismate mutase